MQQDVQAWWSRLSLNLELQMEGEDGRWRWVPTLWVHDEAENEGSNQDQKSHGQAQRKVAEGWPVMALSWAQ